MTSIHWLLGAALAAAQPAGFPCDKLAGELLEVLGRVRNRPGAVPQGRGGPEEGGALRQDRRSGRRDVNSGRSGPLGGKSLLFRRYRDGGETLMCTRMRSDALFGTGDETTQFLLRCLGDRDGDGAFDGFTRRVPLVRVNSLSRRAATAAAVPAVPEPSPWLPFARPVRLVASTGVVDPNAAFRPRARTRIAVSRVQGGEVELGFSGGISSLPDHVESRIGSHLGQVTVRLTMRDGEVVAAGGTRIRFAKRGAKWTGTILDGFGAEPRLLCSGSVAEVGDTFTILGAGRQATFNRSSLPPAE